MEKFEAGPILTDLLGEVGGVTRRVRDWINVGLRLELGKRQVAGEVSTAIEHIRHAAV